MCVECNYHKEVAWETCGYHSKVGDAVSLGRPLGTTKEAGFGVSQGRPVSTTVEGRSIWCETHGYHSMQTGGVFVWGKPVLTVNR